MLILGRKTGQQVIIEVDTGKGIVETIIVSVQDFRPGHVRLGFEAPRGIKVLRRELHDKIRASEKGGAK